MGNSDIYFVGDLRRNQQEMEKEQLVTLKENHKNVVNWKPNEEKKEEPTLPDSNNKSSKMRTKIEHWIQQYGCHW